MRAYIRYLRFSVKGRLKCPTALTDFAPGPSRRDRCFLLLDLSPGLPTDAAFIPGHVTQDVFVLHSRSAQQMLAGSLSARADSPRDQRHDCRAVPVFAHDVEARPHLIVLPAAGSSNRADLLQQLQRSAFYVLRHSAEHEFVFPAEERLVNCSVQLPVR